MTMNTPNEKDIVKVSEKDDSDRDTNEDSDLDTDEDIRRDNNTRLKDYRRQLNKLWESTIKTTKKADDINEGWQQEHEKLETANIKLMEITEKLKSTDWLLDGGNDEPKLPPPQFVSKIPKPKSSSKVPPMPSKSEINQSNIPIKTSVIDKSHKKHAANKPDKMLSTDK